MSTAKSIASSEGRSESSDARARIALIGYGEVGQTVAADFGAAGMDDISVWDKLFADSSSEPSRAATLYNHVRPVGNMREALARRTIIISAVTAANCLAAASEAAASITPQAFYFDLNSVSPRTKSEAAAVIEAAGGRYVEAAVMSAIAPRRTASRMLIGGPHAETFAPLARAIGFIGVEVFDASIGRASATKICRSVMVKGLEALITESLLAARCHGVVGPVIESLRDLFPNEDLERKERYLISRSLQHGNRRAEEMKEAARAVAEVGIEPLMSFACAKRQEWAAAHRPASAPESLSEFLDALLIAARAKSPESA